MQSSPSNTLRSPSGLRSAKLPPQGSSAVEPRLLGQRERLLMERFNPLRWASNIKTEATAFRLALAEAPDPVLNWDILGMRALSHRVVWRLLREHASPRELGIAVFVGVVIGVSPFYGTHVLLALLCSFVFRLNKLAVWAATNVSLPFLAPFLIFVSAQIGHFVLHGQLLPIDLATLKELGPQGVLLDWLVGFPALGVVLGTILGWATARLAAKRQAQTENRLETPPIA